MDTGVHDHGLSLIHERPREHADLFGVCFPGATPTIPPFELTSGTNGSSRSRLFAAAWEPRDATVVASSVR
jgi:hypothetical protein